MRTVILIVAGLLLVALIFWRIPRQHHRLGVILFTFGWLMTTALNLRTGLSHGYTLTEELPIHAVLFGVPVLAAWLWLRRTRAALTARS
jgi:hypothetical protein